jgi:acetolactate synthase small subunit
LAAAKARLSKLVRGPGEQELVADFLELMLPFRILDVSRSGVIAMAKM